MEGEIQIQFQHHPDHTVEYLGRGYRGVKLVNGIWYFRDGNAYRPFPLQHEIRALPPEAGTDAPGQ
jgi:hypothetical protein